MSRAAVREWVVTLGVLAAGVAMVMAPDKAMEGAKSGLTLCAGVIVPSLFPFLILSSLVVELGLAARLGEALGPVMSPLFQVNGSCAAALVLGLVGGYPVGARTAVTLYQKGLCSKAEAQRLLAFCNNSGPAFLLGVVGTGVFGDRRVGLLLYAVHVLAAVGVGLLFRFYGRGREGGRTPPLSAAPGQVSFSAALTRSVAAALQSTLGICAFVVFFAVVIGLLGHFGLLSALGTGLAFIFSPLGLTAHWAERLLTGLLEVSTGVWSLTGVGTLEGRVVMAAFLLGWAGLSVHCQVLSFLPESGLSMSTCLTGKALHALLSAALAALALRLLPLSLPAAALTDAAPSLRPALLTAALAWGVVLLLWGLVAQKSSGKRGRNVV